jgi:hypothetical protein
MVHSSAHPITILLHVFLVVARNVRIGVSGVRSKLIVFVMHLPLEGNYCKIAKLLNLSRSILLIVSALKEVGF